MNLTVIAQPPFEPVTLAQVYKQLRLDPDHAGSPSELSHPDDAMLELHIAAARQFVEQATRRSLVQQTLRLSRSTFPQHCGQTCWPYGAVEGGRIRLHRPPLIRVEAVSYFDGENLEQVIDRDDYYVTDDLLPELRFATGFSAPLLYGRADSLRVEYVTGYAPEGSPATTQQEYAGNVPKALQQCVLLGVQLLYDDLAPADYDSIVRMREAMMQHYRIQLAP